MDNLITMQKKITSSYINKAKIFSRNYNFESVYNSLAVIFLRNNKPFPSTGSAVAWISSDYFKSLLLPQ